MPRKKLFQSSVETETPVVELTPTPETKPKPKRATKKTDSVGSTSSTPVAEPEVVEAKPVTKRRVAAKAKTPEPTPEPAVESAAYAPPLQAAVRPPQTVYVWQASDTPPARDDFAGR